MTSQLAGEVRSQGRLKVCLATMAPYIGGAEVAAERLGLGLQAAGHEVLLLVGTRGPALERFEQAGLRCIYAPMYFTDKWRWLRYTLARRKLHRILRDERPDLLHSNDATTHQILSDAARGLALPRICHHRFGYEPAFVEWLNKFRAEHHLFVSKALMGEIESRCPSVRSGSRTVVYDGLPLPPIPTDAERQQARTTLGHQPGRNVVTFAGQIIPRKGVQDLIRAWMLLDPNLREKAELVIIGDDLDGKGSYRVEMEKLAADIRCPARFVGFQKNVAFWLTASDVSVVPSHAEPLGNATLEAMANGLPVIGGAVGGIPEMVVHDQTGLLVPPANPVELAKALSCLLLEPETRLRFGQEGRRRCETLFSLQAHTDAIVAEYRNVLQRQKPAESA